MMVELDDIVMMVMNFNDIGDDHYTLIVPYKMIILLIAVIN